MMSRIEAREHLDAIRSQGIAYGGYAEVDRQEMLEALHAKAAGDVEDAPVERKRASPEQLAAMGIGFEIVSGPSESSEEALSDV